MKTKTITGQFRCNTSIEDIDGSLNFIAGKIYQEVPLPFKSNDPDNVKMFINEQGHRHILTGYLPDIPLKQMEKI